MKIFIGLIGGLGIFLYGMNLMRTGFQRSTGDKLKKFIELLTNNIFLSVMVGALLTIVIQSSSAATVMIVGLVNAGVLPLTQALGLIMGANIGTTITPQILSFNFYGIESLVLLVGVFLYIFPTKSKYKSLSEIFIGVGLLFTGIQILNTSFEPLTTVPYFKEIITYVSSNPLLGLLAGILITGLVQSSSASIGMLMAICSSGYLPLSCALPIVYGGNIGTCVTALISSVGATKNARRAALMHLIFNILGSAIFILFISAPLETIVAKISPLSISRQIANAHTLFNIINTILLLPFASYLVKLTLKLIPYSKDEDYIINDCIYLDERMLQAPSLALSNTISEVLRMGNKVSLALNCSFEAISYNDLSRVDFNMNFEKTVYKLYINIKDYLFILSKMNLSEENRSVSNSLLSVLKDIEIICNYTEDISTMTNKAIKSNLDLSQIGYGEFTEIYKKTLVSFNNSLIALENNDTTLANSVIQEKKEIYLLENYFRKIVLSKLNNSDCSIEVGIFYLNLLSDLKGIANYSSDIAKQILLYR